MEVCSCCKLLFLAFVYVSWKAKREGICIPIPEYLDGHIHGEGAFGPPGQYRDYGTYFLRLSSSPEDQLWSCKSQVTVGTACMGEDRGQS